MRTLLLEEDRKAVRKEYMTRLLMAVFWFLAASGFLGVLFLSPSYFLSKEQLTSLTNQAASVEGSRTGETSERAELEELGVQIRAVLSRENQLLFSEVLRRLVARKPEGVALSRIRYHISSEEGEIVLAGVARSRSALLDYEQSLEEERLFEEVTLPISQLASESDITFSITVHGNLK